MLRVAVPNKGSLSESAVELLAEAGYRTRRRGRELVLVDAANDVEIFFLRPKDIAVYVGQGRIQAGITGRDLLLDSGTEAIEMLGLGFGRSRFRFAAPASEITALEELQGRRIAASYDRLVTEYLRARGIEAQVIHLDGAVESSVQLGVADAIADVVETGSTLKAAGLTVFGPTILESEAILITAPQHLSDPALRVLEQRLRGVIVARDHVLIDYNIRTDNLEAAAKLAPGLESPTVSTLAESDWKAVRVVVVRREMNQVMDALLDVGAEGIIVTQLVASRLR
ncbi:ATP phosphoribosyltransferase [Actinomyces minihominis]|uniref:ATP phosphoribosyltransferase n=1 Tax=Actinomyces minihominis TaxID=2002838 RepID=UPI000C069A8A|nr:ATP phosphoribosyltransferase [Actinomyces minihominis]